MSIEESLLEMVSSNVRKALLAERKGRADEAVFYYYKAVVALKKLMEIEDRAEIRRIYERRLREYTARIRELAGGAGMTSARGGSRTVSGGTKGEGETSSYLSEAVRDTVLVEKPKVSWDDIADLEKAKMALMEAVVWPLKRPDLFRGGRRPWRGILLFGPPGCGKTLLAKAVASEVNATFINVDSASILSKWLGESEKIVKEIFRMARRKQPSIIFIDEVDAIASARTTAEHDAIHRVKTVFLTQLDGITSRPDDRIVVIGATNLPEMIDPAFRRRFEKRIYVPLPNFEARKQIFKIHLRGVEVADDVDFDELARLTEGYTGHDISLVVREAVMRPVRELAEKGLLERRDVKPRPVGMADFLEALRIIKPSVSPEEVRKYEEWAEKYGTG